MVHKIVAECTYMSDIVQLGTLPPVPSLSPNEVLDEGTHCSRPHMRCIVASERTHSVPTVEDTSTGIARRLSIPESDRVAIGRQASLAAEVANSRPLSSCQCAALATHLMIMTSADILATILAIGRSWR